MNLPVILPPTFNEVYNTYGYFRDPLEQFEIVSVCSVAILGDFTNVAFLNLFSVLLMIISLSTYTLFVHARASYVIYVLFDLVRSIVEENLYIKRQQFLSTLFYLFMTIFLANLIGLIPYSFTPTSSFIITFFLALSYFVGINFIATWQSRWHVFNLFLPAGVPTVGAPFLILIETISYNARVFSLSIRLFANMMSGHALLKILSGFAWALLNASPALSIVAFLPWSIVTSITLLELLIAFLQGYVFITLMTIYINDALNMH